MHDFLIGPGQACIKKFIYLILNYFNDLLFIQKCFYPVNQKSKVSDQRNVLSIISLFIAINLTFICR